MVIFLFKSVAFWLLVANGYLRIYVSKWFSYFFGNGYCSAASWIFLTTVIFYLYFGDLLAMVIYPLNGVWLLFGNMVNYTFNFGGVTFWQNDYFSFQPYLGYFWSMGIYLFNRHILVTFGQWLLSVTTLFLLLLGNDYLSFPQPYFWLLLVNDYFSFPPYFGNS